MVTRKMKVEMRGGGELEISCRGLVATLSRTGSGSWVYNIFENDTASHADYCESYSSQYEAYGALLCKLYELTT